MSNREEGFYWVQFGEGARWEVAEWDGSAWNYTDVDWSLDNEAPNLVGPRLIPPSDCPDGHQWHDTIDGQICAACLATQADPNPPVSDAETAKPASAIWVGLTAAEIAAALSPRASMLVLSWNHDPDAFVDAFDEVEAAGLVGDLSKMPQLSSLGLEVRAILAGGTP